MLLVDQKAVPARFDQLNCENFCICTKRRLEPNQCDVSGSIPPEAAVEP